VAQMVWFLRRREKTINEKIEHALKNAIDTVGKEKRNESITTILINLRQELKHQPNIHQIDMRLRNAHNQIEDMVTEIENPVVNQKSTIREISNSIKRKFSGDKELIPLKPSKNKQEKALDALEAIMSDYTVLSRVLADKTPDASVNRRKSVSVNSVNSISIHIRTNSAEEGLRNLRIMQMPTKTLINMLNETPIDRRLEILNSFSEQGLIKILGKLPAPLQLELLQELSHEQQRIIFQGLPENQQKELLENTSFKIEDIKLTPGQSRK
jgi:hypothetical protein